MEARSRTRSDPPTIPPPPPRVRNRIILPEGMTMPKHWRAPATVPENMKREDVCALGEINMLRRPDQWAGWPNGSLVMHEGGKVQKGRHIATDTGKFHVLLWNRARSCYLYVRLVKSHAEAMSAL